MQHLYATSNLIPIAPSFSIDMNLLQLHNGNKHFGTKALFTDAQFAINEGEHVGVIGPNGAGKTTLFKILVGQAKLDSGELVKSHKLNIGYLEQEALEPLDMSAEAYLSETCTTPLWELKQLGRDLGLLEEHFTEPFHRLSGGYRMRMKLVSLIGREPNLMLLDEPTNFLDLESILALERFLQDYRGAFMLISHDREFLRRVTDHTLEIEQGEITKYPGTIDDYFEQKAQVRSILEAQAANQESKRKHLQDFIDRFGAKATKARQAQSRMKQLEKMEKIEIKDLPVRAHISIPAPISTGKEIMNVTDADLGYDGRAVISQCHLRLERGVHLGVVGFNGAGKSTLLKSLAGRLPLVGGEIQLGHNVSLSYYAQHVSEELLASDTVLESLQRAAAPHLPTQDILSVAGSLLFSGEAVHKKISVLSGGEKARVALGQILLQKSPLILLDEPTNHLDFDTVEALTTALKNYEGTIVVVSHDRSFIGRIATKILEIRDGRADIYPGSYDDYVWSLEKGALSTRGALPTVSSPNLKPVEEPKKSSSWEENKKLHSEQRELQRAIKKGETALQKATEKLSALNLALTDGTVTADSVRELGECATAIEQIETALMEQMERLEQIEALLRK